MDTKYAFSAEIINGQIDKKMGDITLKRIISYIYH
jgi:hypothetical protein